MKPDPKDLVANTARVRVHSGALGSKHVMAEGKVVAYSQHPQICVQADDGTQSWWPVTLPVDVVPVLPPEPPALSVVLRKLPDGLTGGVVYRRYGGPSSQRQGWYPPGELGEGYRLSWAELHEDDAEVVLLVPAAEAPYLPSAVTSRHHNDIVVHPSDEDGDVLVKFAKATGREYLSQAAARGLAAALNAAADTADGQTGVAR